MMKRNVKRLNTRVYDLVVVGGGITGSCIAWDAALRGLHVALLEKADFGGATSANSLKTIHGGLRYLQDGSLSLMRQMIRERQAFLRMAPHLVHPLTCVMPTNRGKKLLGNKWVLGLGLKLNDLISLDRNWGSDPQKVLPNGRILSRADCLVYLPGLDPAEITGGILWHDAQMYNSERLTLAFVRSAVTAGADVANYVAVTAFTRQGTRITGVEAEDQLTGERLQIGGKLVINTAGPWVDQLLTKAGWQPPQPLFPLSTAMNLVTRQINDRVAMGLNDRYTITHPDGCQQSRSRVLFISPWQGYSLIGTIHRRYNGPITTDWVTGDMIRELLAEVNQAYPGANLTPADVYHVHQGFLPAWPDNDDPNGVKLLRSAQIHDHEREDGPSGLMTVVSVKYTTARYVAEQVINLALQKLNRPFVPCRTHYSRVAGGEIPRFAEFVDRAKAKRPSYLSTTQLHHLLYNYGTETKKILAYMVKKPAWQHPLATNTLVSPAEVYHAVQSEMAYTLADVALRRTPLGSAGLPEEKVLLAAARIMANALNWSDDRMKREIDRLVASYSQAVSAVAIKH
jgi:glycerol-3-phosphate dehydrogenase